MSPPTLRVAVVGPAASAPAHGRRPVAVAMTHSASAPQAAGAEPALARDGSAMDRNEAVEPSTVVGWAKVKHDGSLAASRNVVGHVRQGVGVYEVAFKTPSLTQCVYNATLHSAGLIAVNEGSQPNSLTVETRNHQGVPTDLAFHLTATC
jgi:hypothetical protein